jgi:hypothetical protein
MVHPFSRQGRPHGSALTVVFGCGAGVKGSIDRIAAVPHGFSIHVVPRSTAM